MKDNEGAVWKNEKRETDRHPHFTGQAIVEGVEYWVSAWKRDPDGNPRAPALRWTMRRKDERKPERSQEESDDDLPFS